MLLFLIACIAGVLTVLAPCVLPLLPVIVGSSVSGGIDKRRAYTVALSLGISVIVFTLLLKFSTAFIYVPQYAWQWFSGGILVLYGLTVLFPSIWEGSSFINKLYRKSNQALSFGYFRNSFWGDVLVGAALGPVFSTCSPTYFVILATVLPASFLEGFVDLLGYAAGLVAMLLLVALAGQRVVARLGVATESKGWFRRSIGTAFVLIGLVIGTGYLMPIESYLLSHVYDITKIEQLLLEARRNATGGVSLQCRDGRCLGPLATSTLEHASGVAMPDAALEAKKAMRYPRAPELADIAGYVNTDGAPVSIGQYKNEKVVLIDFWTYSCINCQRTLPYLKAWDEKYRDQGLVIIGVHTPEFAFEKLQQNVENAVKGFGIRYPVVLDNAYGTWNAFSNSYWPRKYLIDIDGFVVYDHAGEGNYEETERAIQAALRERAARAGETLPEHSIAAPEGTLSVDGSQLGSPEVYFGAERNEYFGSATPGIRGVQKFTLPEESRLNTLYFGGTWNIEGQYAESVRDAKFRYQYRAKEVYLVAGSKTGTPIRVEVTRDGEPLDPAIAGSDVMFSDGKSYISVGPNTLYKVIKDSAYGTHELEFTITREGLQVYTFTFG